MIKQLLISFLPFIGVVLIIWGALMTYSERFSNYWYKNRDFSKSPRKYIIARYWAGSRSVLAGFAMLVIYVLYNESLARSLMSLFL